MKLSGVLTLLFVSVAAATDAGWRRRRSPQRSAGPEDELPGEVVDETIPENGICCNCINVGKGFECLERGDICVRCAKFSSGEGEHTFKNGQSTGPVDGNIYYPAEGAGPWPVISFGHGKGNNGVKADRTRRNLHLFMVGMGFVVVANREKHHWPASNFKAQLDVLDWLYESEYADLADRSTTVLMGHSMGGRGTLTNVANPETLAKYNVKAAIAMHPWCIDRCRSGTGDCGIPLVPTLWITGNKDSIAINGVVYTHYVAQVLSDKVFVEREGMGHNYPDNFLYDNDASMENAYRRFVDCEVFGDEAACVALFGVDDLSDQLGEVGEGVGLAIERDDDPAGFFQPWRGDGFFPTDGANWMDPEDGYSRTEGYRLTTGPTTCTDERDCKGRNAWCIFECRNPVFCGKRNNCQKCRDEPNYPSAEEIDGDELVAGMYKGMRQGALEV